MDVDLGHGYSNDVERPSHDVMPWSTLNDCSKSIGQFILHMSRK